MVSSLFSSCGRMCRSIFDLSVRDEDFARFNEREGQIQTVTAEYKKIQLRLKSFEETQAELRDKTLLVAALPSP
jgi:hypothetical protein